MASDNAPKSQPFHWPGEFRNDKSHRLERFGRVPFVPTRRLLAGPGPTAVARDRHAPTTHRRDGPNSSAPPATPPFLMMSRIAELHRLIAPQHDRAHGQRIRRCLSENPRANVIAK